MKKSFFLLPWSFRFPGILFLIIGSILGISRFYFGIKPDFFDMKVFAVYSSFLGNKFTEVIRNNMCEEFTLLFLVLGLFLIAFSREKEENARINTIRLNAFFISAYANLIFLILSLFLTYGFAFIYMILTYSVLTLVVYIMAFRLLLKKIKPETTDSLKGSF